MALNTPQLKANILQLLTDMEQKTIDSKEEYASRLASAIETFVKSGTVNTTVASGIPVSTAGTATAQTGATTSVGSGTGYIE